MAAVININCVLRDVADIADILQELKKGKLDTKIVKAFSMDNWRWENQREIHDLSAADQLLRDQKIIVVNTGIYPFRDSGMYIEKSGDKYIYDFWINTEGFPELDSDDINARNKRFLEKLQNIAMQFVTNHISVFEMLSIGNETVFKYRGNIEDTVRDTAGVFVWMFPQTLNIAIPMQGYGKRECDCVEIYSKGSSV